MEPIHEPILGICHLHRLGIAYPKQVFAPGRGGGCTRSKVLETPKIITYFQGGYYLWELEY